MTPTAENFILDGFRILVHAAHAHSLEKGFCGEPDLRNEAELIALAHSELSEALGYIRQGNMVASDHIPDFLGIEEELADTVIRICDLAGGHAYRLGEAIIAKIAFNKTRGHKHGKQF